MLSLAFGALGALDAVVLGACSSTAGLTSGEDDPKDSGVRPKDSGRVDDGSAPPTDGPAPVTARCDPAKPFGAPELVTAFDATTDYVKGAIRSPDELEVFYLRYQGSGNWDLRHARRSTKTEAWGSLETIPQSPSPDGFLSLTAGGVKLYFWTIDSNYRTTRASTSSVFGAPVSYDVANGPGAFFVQADDKAYWAKLEEGGAERTIRVSSVTTGGFSFTSSVVPGIHVTGAQDQYPVLNESETILYFSSDRPGGLGLADIWVSKRASKTDPWATPTHVAPISSDKPDQVTWVANDDCELYLDRASHVYLAKRPN